MRLSLFRLRYYLGLRDAFNVFWHGYTTNFKRLKLNAYKHPVYLRGPQDYDGFDFILVAKDYKFRLPHVPQTILDGGGNIGLAAIYFANRFPEAAIVSVEPDGGNFEWLQKNTSSYPKIKLLHGGLWGYPAWLKTIDKGLGTTSIEVEEVAEGTPEAVRAYSISEIMKMEGWQTIDLIKLDIEGAEKHLAENGADEWLPRTKFIAIEFHDRRRKDSSKAFFNALAQHNFSMEPLRECLLFYNEDLIQMFAPYAKTTTAPA